MNKRVHSIIMLTLLVSTASAANWIYDPAPGTITDGEWTFAATVNGTSLAVGACSADPGAVATLDFAKGVTSPDGTTTYTITTLNPQFSTYGNKTRVGELRLPASGLTTLSANAFNGCTTLTNVVNFLPDSVTTLGESVFESVPSQQSLRLHGVASLPKKCFKNSSITEVTFGSALKTLNGGWASGCFDSCKKLTTLNFDPGMTGGTIFGEGVFANCSKLTGTVDFSGFTNLGGSRPFYQYGGSIKKIILSSSLTVISDSILRGVSSVKTIEFTAGPPSITGTSLYKIYNYTTDTSLSDLYTIVPEAHKNAWAQYCENDTINDFDSLWDHALVPEARTRNLLLVYQSEGGGGGEPGHWIYNAAAGTVSNGVWTFSATLTLRNLTVGACTAYPAAPSPLDFSKNVTDTEGTPLRFTTLSPHLCTGTDYRSSSSSPAGLAVSELLLPANGLKTVGAGAFAHLANCAKVEPLLPDSIITLGEGAFKALPCAQDARLVGVAGTIGTGTFTSSKITSVVFGPDLKCIAGWAEGAFTRCTSLTNVAFDAAMSGASFYGIRQDGFYGCSSLKGTIDLTGFSDLSYVSDYGGTANPLSGTGIDTVLVGAGCTKLGARFFNGMDKLETVVFMGAPPTIITNQIDLTRSAGKLFDGMPERKITTYVYKAHKAAWAPYAANGEIGKKGSTWIADYVTPDIDLSLRPLLGIDMVVGICVVVR